MKYCENHRKKGHPPSEYILHYDDIYKYCLFCGERLVNADPSLRVDRDAIIKEAKRDILYQKFARTKKQMIQKKVRLHRRGK